MLSEQHLKSSLPCRGPLCGLGARETSSPASFTLPNTVLQGSRGDPGDLGPRGDAGPPGPKVKYLHVTLHLKGYFDKVFSLPF